MHYFNSIKELVNLLARSKELLSEMFEKRKSFDYKLEHAIELIEENNLKALVEFGVIRQNGTFLEIDEKYLNFFEEVLEVNEEINTSFINEQIQNIKDNIDFFLQETNDYRKYKYLKTIKSSLRKTGRIIIRNIISLQRNIDNTFKTEPNYKIKKLKLEKLDIKLEQIIELIHQTEHLISEGELTFFRNAADEELTEISVELRLILNEARHNLAESQKQIIDYLNQIKNQSEVIEQIRQVKYLKDQVELRAKSNIDELLSKNSDIFFAPRTTFPVKISLKSLENDDVYQIIRKVNQIIKTDIKPTIEAAAAISEEYLNDDEIREYFIDYEEIKNRFTASGNHLFDFIMKYKFDRDVSFSEKITLYCQIISLYEEELKITQEYRNFNEVEYAVVYPK